jgi:hypothetical protein
MLNGLECVACSTFQKGPKFGHSEFKPEYIRGHHPIAHITEFVS